MNRHTLFCDPLQEADAGELTTNIPVLFLLGPHFWASCTTLPLDRWAQVTELRPRDLGGREAATSRPGLWWALPAPGSPTRCRGCREGFHGPRNPPELLDEEALHPTALEEVNPANDYAVNLEVGPSDETTLLTGCSLVTP